MTITQYDTRYLRVDPPTAVACPAWCNMGQGHPFENTIDDRPSRNHRHTIGDPEDACADVQNVVVWRDGTEADEEAPYLVVWINGNSSGEEISDPEQARRLAACLNAAADVLERVRS